MTTVTKPLEATLAPPTAHKAHRLERTVATYRRARSDALEQRAETPTAVTDVVTRYTRTSDANDSNAVARTPFWRAARFLWNLATAATIAGHVDPWGESVR